MEMNVASSTVDDGDRLYYGVLIFSGLCLLAAAILLVGEVMEWWNDLGQVGIPIFSVIGALGTILAFFFGAGRRQVKGVAAGVGRIEGQLGSMDHKLENLDALDVIEAQLNHQSGALDRQVAILTQIRDRL